MAVYTRQSSAGIVDGGVIEAVDLNNEFDQLAAAFLAPTFGVGTAGTDIVLTFDGETNDGIITWMEDEDLFKFSDAINVGVDGTGYDVKFFGDTSGSYWLWDQSADGVVQIGSLTVGVDDAGHDVKFFGNTASAYMLWDTSADDLVLAGAAGIDLAGDIDVDGTANLDNTDIDGTLAVDGTTISLDATTSLNIDNSNTSNGITIGTATSSVPISIGHATSEVTVNDNLTVTGTLTLGSGAELTEAELEFLDGITAGTVAASKAVVVDSNKDAASFRNITLTGELDAATLDISGNADIDGTLEADAITIGSTAIGSIYGVVAGSSSIVTTGALDSGSITSGFGTIDTGSSTITTTGLISGGSLDIDDVLINGTTIGHTDDTDLLTLTSGLLTVAGEVSMTTLDIGGTNVTSTAAELNYSDTGAAVGTVVASKVVTADSNKDVASFRNITLTGELDAGSLDVSGDADIDGTLEADAITIGSTAIGSIYGVVAGSSSIVTTGALDSGSITSGFGTIDTGSSAITSTGAITGGSLVADDVTLNGKVITMTGSASDTAIFTAGTHGTLSIVTTDAAAAAANIQITADGTVDIDSAGVLTLDSGAAINIEPASGSAILLDGTISVDAGVVTGATSITSTAFVGDITGDVTGNTSGSAATVTTAAQGNITSLGTLTTLTVDDVAVNGKVITMTGSASDTAVITAGTHGTLDITTTDAAAAAANIQITADGTAELAGTTVTLDSGADIVLDAAGNNVTFKSGGTSILDFSNSSSDAVITSSVQDKDIIFKGDDGGSAVTALTMDMSAAGKSIFGAGAIGATYSVTGSGSITMNFDLYTNFQITANGNVTLANGTGTLAAGQSGVIVLIQDGTGSRTISTGSDYEWPAATVGTISTAANAVDVIPYYIDADDSILLGAPQLAMATPS